jgi:hypothetical protein
LGTSRVLEITLELVGALELNFTTWRIVGWEISKLGAVSQADANCRDLSTYSARWLVVWGVSQGCWTAYLGLSIALVDMDAESNLVKSQHLRWNRCWGRDHGFESPSELCFNFLENGSIVELVIESSLIFVIIFLGIDGLIKKPLYKAALLRNGFHDLGIHSVKDTRDTAHESWLQALHVLHQLERVSTVVPGLEALQEGEDEDTLLEGVTVGQVRDHRIFFS